MFDSDWDGYDAAATLDAVAEYDAAENEAALGKLLAALHFADLHAELQPAPEHARRLSGGERLTVYGGDGCPAIAEFAPLELGALLKISSRAAAAYLGEGLALRHRFPRLWAKTRNGQAIVWRARSVARACLALSAEAAALVDAQVVGLIDTLTMYRLQKIIDAVILELDPAAARKAAEDYARARGVWVQPSDEHGTKTIYVKAAAGDVIRFDATITDLAWALAMMGDTDPLDARRAKALGWIADPTAAHELIAAARLLATRQHPTPAGNTNPGTTAHPDAPDQPNTTAHQGGTDDRRASTPPRDTTIHTNDPGDDYDGGALTADINGFSSGEPDGDHHTTAANAEASDANQQGASACPPVSSAGQQDTAVSRAGDRSEGEANNAGPPDDWFVANEPGRDDEADRDPPHPSRGDHLAHLDNLSLTDLRNAISSLVWKHDPKDHLDLTSDDADQTDDQRADHQRSGDERLAATRPYRGSGRGRFRNVLYAHITDENLLSGDGIIRVEEYGPLLAAQLRELLGHNHVTIQPVIDLNDKVHVEAYEIPTRIRERIKLAYPVERFPYGTTATTMRTDLDHIQPYTANGPPDQTSTDNLAPLGRQHHRAKTHGRWRVRRCADDALEWTTPNGLRFRVDHTGTHRIPDDPDHDPDRDHGHGHDHDVRLPR